MPRSRSDGGSSTSSRKRSARATVSRGSPRVRTPEYSRVQRDGNGFSPRSVPTNVEADKWLTRDDDAHTGMLKAPVEDDDGEAVLDAYTAKRQRERKEKAMLQALRSGSPIKDVPISVAIEHWKETSVRAGKKERLPPKRPVRPLEENVEQHIKRAARAEVGQVLEAVWKNAHAAVAASPLWYPYAGMNLDVSASTHMDGSSTSFMSGDGGSAYAVCAASAASVDTEPPVTLAEDGGGSPSVPPLDLPEKTTPALSELTEEERQVEAQLRELGIDPSYVLKAQQQSRSASAGASPRSVSSAPHHPFVH